MANAAKLALRSPVRAMLVGYPGAGKTGALASIANMGYKIRFLDFDGNTEPLLRFTKPEFLPNIDIVYFEDKMRRGAKGFEPLGNPTAFAGALDMMDHWKYTEADGTIVDLGASKDWGCDTVVVLDSLTAMGEAAMRRVMFMANKNIFNRTQQVWGIAQGEQEAFVNKLTSKSNNFHVIVLAHLKMISPKDVQSGDSDLTKQLKEKAADLVPTRLFPSALGQALPPIIGGHFPTLLLVEPKYLPGNKVKRMIKSVPRADLDLKVPIATDQQGDLEIETGLAHLFGILAPPLASCTGVVAQDDATLQKQ
jgi:hypothetical protein